MSNIAKNLNNQAPKALKEIPTFATEEEEREFWATHDSTEYVDWDEAQRVRFPNLKRSSFHTKQSES